VNHEVAISIGGEKQEFLRAADQHGAVLDVLIQSRRSEKRLTA
jgi:transposase-like protein